MKKVLIAGCGDLGLELARRLADAGYEATGLRRSAQPMPDGVHSIVADVTRPDTLADVVALQPEIVVYCVSATEHTDENYRLSYVEGLRNVLAALHRDTLRHVFFVSSTGVYGQETQDILDETIPAQVSDFSGQRMLEAEALLNDYPASILRFSGIYGPGRTRMISLAQNPQQWPPRNGWTNRIHRDDGAAFIVHLMHLLERQSLERLYLVTDDQPMPLYALLQWLAQEQKVKIEQEMTVPAVKGNKRLSNQRMHASGYHFIYPDYQAGYRALLAMMN